MTPAFQTPNELVGLRIRTDEHNFIVVLVKRHGAASKYAGQAYDTPLGYYGKLEHAAAALIDRAARLRAEMPSAEFLDGDVTWARTLLDAVTAAKADALAAVAALRAEGTAS